MLGMHFAERGEATKALPYLRRCVAQDTGATDARFILAQTLSVAEQFDEALELYNSLVDADDRHWQVHNNLASLLRQEGRVDEALSHWRRARDIVPDNPVVQSNIILASLYTPNETPKSRSAEIATWAERFEAPLRAAWPIHQNDSDPERPLRIGYLSSDFKRHPIGFFMGGVVANHDRRRHQIYCYSGTRTPDSYTQEFERLADHWRNVVGKGDAEIAALVSEDKIDILVDLAGHTAGNSLRVLARKPAPVQFLAGGHTCTTGMEAVDFAISDMWQNPPGSDYEFTEQLIRLASGYVCYTPPNYAPDVSPLPAENNGYITFGCLNNIAKLSDNVIELWGEILRAMPSAVLLLASRGFAGDGAQTRYLDLFAAQDIDPSRIKFARSASHKDYLGYYGNIDIALDPFPYSGGLTTCEALWMGVPVITLDGGETFASRHSTTHLSRTGLTQNICGSTEAYVARAIAMAGDPPTLAETRRTLRDQVASSVLCDCRGHTRELEAAYRAAWREWCKRADQLPPTH